jgi:hypothetical protein
VAKLTGYAYLQQATGIPTPVLFWFTPAVVLESVLSAGAWCRLAVED